MVQAGGSESIRDDAFPIATSNAIISLMRLPGALDRDGPQPNRPASDEDQKPTRRKPTRDAEPAMGVLDETRDRDGYIPPARQK